MRNAPQALSTLVLLIALIFIIEEINRWISLWGWSLQADILFVIFAGLYLRVLHGLWICVLIGMILDVFSPFTYGMRASGLLLLWLGVVWGRKMIQREHSMQIRMLVLPLHLLWLFAATLLFSQGRLGEWHYWQRFIWDACTSGLFVIAVAPLWCEIQRQYLYMLGWDLNAGNHRV